MNLLLVICISSFLARCDVHFSCWDGAFEDVPLRTLGAVTTYIASASYGLPYLLTNAQSDIVLRVGALALSVAMLFTFQGARCAGCEPLTLLLLFYLLSTSIIIAAEPAKINCFVQFLLFK